MASEMEKMGFRAPVERVLTTRKVAAQLLATETMLEGIDDLLHPEHAAGIEAPELPAGDSYIAGVEGKVRAVRTLPIARLLPPPLIGRRAS
jgi:hypothetical protein